MESSDGKSSSDQGVVQSSIEVSSIDTSRQVVDVEVSSIHTSQQLADVDVSSIDIFQEVTQSESEGLKSNLSRIGISQEETESESEALKPDNLIIQSTATDQTPLSNRKAEHSSSRVSIQLDSDAAGDPSSSDGDVSRPEKFRRLSKRLSRVAIDNSGSSTDWKSNKLRRSKSLSVTPSEPMPPASLLKRRSVRPDMRRKSSIPKDLDSQSDDELRRVPETAISSEPKPLERTHSGFDLLKSSIIVKVNTVTRSWLGTDLTTKEGLESPVPEIGSPVENKDSTTESPEEGLESAEPEIGNNENKDSDKVLAAVQHTSPVLEAAKEKTIDTGATVMTLPKPDQTINEKSPLPEDKLEHDKSDITPVESSSENLTRKAPETSIDTLPSGLDPNSMETKQENELSDVILTEGGPNEVLYEEDQEKFQEEEPNLSLIQEPPSSEPQTQILMALARLNQIQSTRQSQDLTESEIQGEVPEENQGRIKFASVRMSPIPFVLARVNSPPSRSRCQAISSAGAQCAGDPCPGDANLSEPFLELENATIERSDDEEDTSSLQPTEQRDMKRPAFKDKTTRVTLQSMVQSNMKRPASKDKATSVTDLGTRSRGLQFRKSRLKSTPSFLASDSTVSKAWKPISSTRPIRQFLRHHGSMIVWRHDCPLAQHTIWDRGCSVHYMNGIFQERNHMRR